MKKYYYKDSEIYWCGLCDTFAITCPQCKIESCTGGGCDKCAQLWKDWSRDYNLVTLGLNRDEFIDKQAMGELDLLDKIFGSDNATQTS